MSFVDEKNLAITEAFAVCTLQTLFARLLNNPQCRERRPHGCSSYVQRLDAFLYTVYQPVFYLEDDHMFLHRD